MKELFAELFDAIASGSDAALCSIIASSGSTPRGSGAKMAVFSGGSAAGTIGGGAVEHEAIQLAQKALIKREAFTRRFELSPNQTADIGMVCGGHVDVYFQFFEGGDKAALELLEYVLSLFDRHIDSWLITGIAEGTARRMAVYSREDGLRFGSGAKESALLPLIKPRAMLDKDAGFYAEPLTRGEIVYVFGGGHVSQELVPVLAHIGFAVAVFEDRQAFADSSRFPGAVSVINGDFADIKEKINLRPCDYAVVMTRGHQADLDVLSQALRTEASYIGVIGSRHKTAAVNKKLVESGIPEAALARIHTPIGLPIGAETPAEIAISVAAELIAHRAGVLKEKA